MLLCACAERCRMIRIFERSEHKLRVCLAWTFSSARTSLPSEVHADRLHTDWLTVVVTVVVTSSPIVIASIHTVVTDSRPSSRCLIHRLHSNCQVTCRPPQNVRLLRRLRSWQAHQASSTRTLCEFPSCYSVGCHSIDCFVKLFDSSVRFLSSNPQFTRSIVQLLISNFLIRTSQFKPPNSNLSIQTSQFKLLSSNF